MDNSGLSRSLSKVKSKITGLINSSEDDQQQHQYQQQQLVSPTGSCTDSYSLKYQLDQTTTRHSLPTPRHSATTLPPVLEEQPITTQNSSSMSATPPSLEASTTLSTSVDILLPPAPMSPNNMISELSNPFEHALKNLDKRASISCDPLAKHATPLTPQSELNDFADAMALSILDKVEVDGSTQSEWKI